MSPDEKWMEKLASAARRRGLVDATFDTVSTAIGDLTIVVSDEGVCRVAFRDEVRDDALDEVADVIGARVVRSKSGTTDITKAFQKYLDGRRDDLPFEVDFRLMHAPFRRSVLEKLHKVRRGRVVTYGELARQTGHPRAARAVGTACATNPVPIIVPCHRVVPSSGGVGSYGGGPDIKRYLLELEGVHLGGSSRSARVGAIG